VGSIVRLCAHMLMVKLRFQHLKTTAPRTRPGDGDESTTMAFLEADGDERCAQSCALDRALRPCARTHGADGRAAERRRLGLDE
jgi:hypothetical protein